VTTEHPSHITPSQSADPDKAARFSRVYTPSTTFVSVIDAETTLVRSDTGVQLTSPSVVDVVMHNSTLHGVIHAEADHESREAEVYQRSMQDTNITPSLVSSRYLRERWLHDSTSASTNSAIKIGFSENGSTSSSLTTRKVQVTDFEMIRVLGIGCAGKVLLVRHKRSSDLYALKAISKRHVLAQKELQHTLTEQAVLRRMAAEGTDPFVVKLWWSFHDKENLFLVMVRLPCICTQYS
jgi:hypothetical protein